MELLIILLIILLQLLATNTKHFSLNIFSDFPASLYLIAKIFFKTCLQGMLKLLGKGPELDSTKIQLRKLY